MIEPNDAKDKYRTTRDLHISGFLIPKGFEFDGMSAPFALRSFVGGPYRPRCVEAVILHDYLYETKKTTRALADKMFYKLLKFEGVKCARLFYWAVRLFGGLHYG